MLARRTPIATNTAAAAADDDDVHMSTEMESQLLRTLATLSCVEDSLVQLHEVKPTERLSCSVVLGMVEGKRLPG